MSRSSIFLLFAIAIFSACSVTSQDEAFDSVGKMSAKRGAEGLIWLKTQKDIEAVARQVDEILKKPLDMDSMVRITLINNRSLQQTYEQIGIAHSDLVQAGLMTNPLFGYSVGHGVSSATIEFAFLDLLWIPLRKELGAIALEDVKLSVGDEILKTLRDAKKAYIDAKVLQETMHLREKILTSHEASVQLAARQYASGNLAKREFLKIQDEYAHMRVDMLRISQENAVALETLNRLMGLYGTRTYYTLSDKPLAFLELPPQKHMLEEMAISNRLDMAAAQAKLRYAAKEAGYTQDTRLLSEVTVEGGSEVGVKIPLPIFDMGQGRVTKAQAKYNQSVQRVYELAVNIRSQTREAYAKSHYAYDIAKEYQINIVPANKNILEETQLFYNGMLDDTYELLASQRRFARIQIDAIESIGAFQKTELDLEYIVGGRVKSEAK